MHPLSNRTPQTEEGSSSNETAPTPVFNVNYFQYFLPPYLWATLASRLRGINQCPGDDAVERGLYITQGISLYCCILVSAYYVCSIIRQTCKGKAWSKLLSPNTGANPMCYAQATVLFAVGLAGVEIAKLSQVNPLCTTRSFVQAACTTSATMFVLTWLAKCYTNRPKESHPLLDLPPGPGITMYTPVPANGSC
jgi:hypothetical protein